MKHESNRGMEKGKKESEKEGATKRKKGKREEKVIEREGVKVSVRKEAIKTKGLEWMK